MTIPSAAERGQTEGEEEASLESAIADWRNRLDPWVMIPQVLSVFWPKDPDVEQFLYEMQHTDEGETTALTTLFLLNVGKFTSSEANAFRIDQLRDSNEGMGAPTAVAWAAEGLALSIRMKHCPR